MAERKHTLNNRNPLYQQIPSGIQTELRFTSSY